MKKNNMRKLGFSFLCMLAVLFSFQGAKAQQAFGSTPQDLYSNEYIFSEVTPSDMGIKDITNSILEENNNQANEDPDPWNPGGPGGEGDGDGQPVGTGAIPIGDGLGLLLFSAIAYGAIIFIRRQQQYINNKEIK